MADTEYAPLKGDPDLLATKAAHYQTVAAQIARSVQTLTKIQGEKMTSKAIDKLRESSGDVADDITKAYDRYDTTAKALAAYAVELRGAQDDAKTAIAQIEEKQAAADAANRSASTAQDAADNATDDQKTDAQKTAQQAQTAADDANSALTAAHNLWHAAHDRKVAAAKTAASAIDGVVNGKGNHGLKDSWWDNWGSKVYDIIKQVCKWAGVLSIFFGWIPIIGQILLVLAAIGAVLDLIDAVVAAITGDGSVFDIIMAVVGVALTFVGGAAFARLAKELKAVTAIKAGEKVFGGAVTDIKAARTFKSISGGEKRIATILTDSRKVMKQTSFRDVALDMLKDSTKQFRPNLSMEAIAKLKPTSLADTFKKAFEEGIIPNPQKLLKLNGDFVAGARYIAMDPKMLKSAEVAVPLFGTSIYQADQTYKAVSGYISDGQDSPGKLATSLGGDAVGATSSIISDIRSLEWKNNG
jgi:membrane protein YqaA with SNARE-associated domain